MSTKAVGNKAVEMEAERKKRTKKIGCRKPDAFIKMGAKRVGAASPH